LWKRIFKSIKSIRRKEIKTNVGKTDGFSIPLNINKQNKVAFKYIKVIHVKSAFVQYVSRSNKTIYVKPLNIEKQYIFKK